MQDKTLSILVDMDGILVDFLGQTLAKYNTEYGDTLSLADMRHSEFELNTKPEFTEQCMKKYMSTPGFFFDMKPLPGALEAMKLLHEEGHDLCIATSPAEANSYGEKVAWLKQHLPFLGKDNIMIGRPKWRLHADILIDDYPRNISRYRETWPDAKVFAIKYPYNQHTNAHVLAEDCTNTWVAWQTLVEQVDAVATGIFGSPGLESA